MDFQLIYDGEGLVNHEISPRDLSIALVAINDLLENADKIINKGKTKTEIKVKASFETGCFKINFSSTQSFLNKAIDLFNSDAVNAGLNAVQILGLVFGGVLSLAGLLKFLKGSKPDKIIENSDGSFSVIKDKKELKTEKAVIDLYKDYKLRKSFEDLVMPLKKDGIDDFAVKTGNKDEFICQIKKDEIDWFKCPIIQEEQLDEPQIFETNISIINLSFKEGNKWFVNDGGENFYAIVEDKDFLDRIDSSFVKFSKGDILRVGIKRVQYYNIDEKKLKSEHFIQKVLKHTTPAQTISLFENK